MKELVVDGVEVSIDDTGKTETRYKGRMVNVVDLDSTYLKPLSLVNAYDGDHALFWLREFGIGYMGGK